MRRRSNKTKDWPKERAEYRKMWDSQNHDKVLGYKSKWDDKNREKTRDYAKLWRDRFKQADPEGFKEYVRKNRLRQIQRDPIHFFLLSKKSYAKSKGIEFDITPHDLEIPETCPVLGMRLKKFGIGKGRATSDTASIDRIDPKKGYVKGNVNVISLRANRLKYDCTDPEELRAVANYVEQCNIKANS